MQFNVVWVSNNCSFVISLMLKSQYALTYIAIFLRFAVNRMAAKILPNLCF